MHRKWSISPLTYLLDPNSRSASAAAPGARGLKVVARDEVRLVVVRGWDVFREVGWKVGLSGEAKSRVCPTTAGVLSSTNCMYNLQSWFRSV